MLAITLYIHPFHSVAQTDTLIKRLTSHFEQFQHSQRADLTATQTVTEVRVDSRKVCPKNKHLNERRRA